MSSLRIAMTVRPIAVTMVVLAVVLVGQIPAQEFQTRIVPQYHVAEWMVRGPEYGPRDVPARDVRFTVTFRHQLKNLEYEVPGFWDGDGRGGVSGNVFKVRFCPTARGKWTITHVESNKPQLRNQLIGKTLQCVRSEHPGFWIPEGRWYRRSDGSHPFIVGNTHYSFLSRFNDEGRMPTDAVDDIRKDAHYYKKLRFSLFGDRYPDPDLKPFLDDEGRQTDDGRYSHRPNPQWFHERVDPVIRAGFAENLICDLILCGPDTRQSRATLKNDPQTWLRYAAARYGSYPHVWFCLSNEWNIKQPRYSAKEIIRVGRFLRDTLPYPTPISVHANSGNWNWKLTGDWHDHTIIQWKLKQVDQAADAANHNVERGGGKPVLNDENAYEGQGDRFSELDVIEGCLGTVMGGGYPTTGEKHGRKLGQYFWGGFDADVHRASDNLHWLRRYLDTSVDFWRLKPLPLGKSPFTSAPENARVLADQGREYLLGANWEGGKSLEIELPPGKWLVRYVNLTEPSTVTRAICAEGHFDFKPAPIRAGLVHLRRRDTSFKPRTVVSLVDGCWHINGQVTYPGSAAEGLLMNVRMVNSTFEDLKRPKFDVEANTERFVTQIPDYRRFGVRAFTLNLQGGMPGYEGAVNSAFHGDGALKAEYLSRVRRVIEVCDRLGMVVILGCYYQRQDQVLDDEQAVRQGIKNSVAWIRDNGFRNVVLEIANEYPHGGFDHDLIRSAKGQAELIKIAKSTHPGLLVSTSGIGNGRLHKLVAEAADFLLIHFNGVEVDDIPARIEALKHYGKPIVCNEDDKQADEAARAARLSVENGASWGLMLNDLNQYVPFEFQGGEDDPVVYATLRRLTMPRPEPDTWPLRFKIRGATAPMHECCHRHSADAAAGEGASGEADSSSK